MLPSCKKIHNDFEVEWAKAFNTYLGKETVRSALRPLAVSTFRGAHRARFLLFGALQDWHSVATCAALEVLSKVLRRYSVRPDRTTNSLDTTPDQFLRSNEVGTLEKLRVHMENFVDNVIDSETDQLPCRLYGAVLFDYWAPQLDFTWRTIIYPQASGFLHWPSDIRFRIWGDIITRCVSMRSVRIPGLHTGLLRHSERLRAPFAVTLWID